MAEKDNKSKTTTKSAATSAKSASKPATTAKSSSPASKTTTASKSSAATSAKPAQASKTAAETSATTKDAKTASKTTASATAAKASKSAAAKPVEKTAASVDKKAVASVVAKYSASRGVKTTVVGDLKKEKAKAQAQQKTARKADAAAAKKQSKAKSAKTVNSTENNGGVSAIMGKVAAMVKTRDFKLISMMALAIILILSLILGLVIGLKGCTPDAFSIENSPRNKTQVGYSSEIIGTVERYKPVDGVQAAEFSKGTYPTYGSTLSLTTAQKTELISLNRKLTANGTWVDASARTTGTYDMMDKDGYLYKKDGSKPGAGVPEQLYKHTASIGMYGGNVADDEPAVIKNITLRPRSYSSYYSVTGLYAPAGEVIKIQMTNADMVATGGITIHIGQALYNGQANNIWEQRNFNRMPVILNTMSITKETTTYDEETGLWTGYVGSFLGGPIYVRDESSTFSVTISGGVNYAHFILGVTTEEDYALYSQSSAPYFDLEVWDRGVLHSGPKRRAQRFNYEQLSKAAVLWEKITLVTTSVSNQGVVFIYDPFVAAGAAVAFPGRRSVNCPEGWMTESLNYASFVTSGSWGNMHEYHHNFQDYGLGSGADGEVTNNGLNLVSYSLFTKISAARQLGNYGGAGLSGWNCYTSASWALQRVNTGAIGSTNGLAVYATLLHNFGQDAYINARGARGSAYLDKWANITHQDMTYYANMVKSYGISGGSYSPSQAVKDANYPLFVPVSSVYQTGRTYMYGDEKREIITMQPYVIPAERPFTVDLNPYTTESGQYRSGSVIIGNGFKYTIKSVNTDEVNGTFVENGDGVYTFTPNSELLSGKIYVTLEITTTDGAKEWNGHKLNDVDLVLEFQQSHESNKAVLERTTYFYTADTAYTDARTAYEQGYAGYERKNDREHSNPTQNANTDIWYCTESSISKFPKANPELDIVTPNSIDEVRGKLYFPEAGTYNIYLRGRKSCAVYYSLDGGKTYQLGAYIHDNATSANWREDKYFKLTLEAESWVYFKEVLINVKISDSMAGFIGLGIGQWTVPRYTTEVKYYTEINGARTNLTQETVDGETKYYYTQNGSKVYVENASVKAETIYKNASGQVVTAEEAANTDLIAPTSISYATAYKPSYEFVKEFESDYFYTRKYTYSYSDVAKPSEDAAIVSAKNVTAYNDTPLSNMLQDNSAMFRASSSKSPAEITVDLGYEITANRVDLYGYLYNGNSYHPKNFYILVGTSPDDISTPFGPHWEDVKSTNGNTGFRIDESLTFRYYKIVIEKWSYGAIQFRYIKFSYVIPGTATLYSPDEAQFTYKGTWKIAQTNSHFGHVYVGSNGAEVSFEYEAKNDSGRFGILSSSKYGQDFEVYIDGKKVEAEKLKADSEGFIPTLSPILTEGKHKVVIKCVGEANIDSIIFY